MPGGLARILKAGLEFRGMELNCIFEVAVIGLGLIGSAACRYLSLSSDSVLGVGPPEPRDWKTHTGVFASHYDEARLTRVVDKDDVWSKLAARSIESYKSVEASGIKFHHPVGFLRVTPFYQEQGDTLLAAYETGKRNGAAVELIESGGAGYVNPRALVQAQLEVAAKHDALIVTETAVSIEPTESGVIITTDSGRLLRAKKVLICADAYSNSLLPNRELALTTHLVSVLLGEVDTEEAEKLKSMPSIIWRLHNHPYFHSIYASPPVSYPDGKRYIKIGGRSGNHTANRPLRSLWNGFTATAGRRKRNRSTRYWWGFYRTRPSSPSLGSRAS